MATIRARKKADGTVSYTVQIRLKKKGVIVYQEAQTFARKQAAQAWAKRRETELAVPGAIERASRKGHTVKEMIERYLIEAEKARPLGETKRLTLNAIKKSYLGEKIDSDISQQVLVDYALWRMGPEGGSVKPQTAGNDLAHLGSVLSLARAAWGYEINPLAMPDARLVLKKFGYNMRSRERDRRPSLDEHRKAVKVRDMKNPGQKLGNDVWCHLPDEAWQIVQSMPRECPEIFPYNTDSVGTAWAKACKMKGIEDLHFHDLRHEGVSRLFEMDWDIPRVSSVSGHRDWNSMRRYTHLRGRGDGYKGWKWLDQIIQAPVKLGARVG
ncbi:tyrosine-type recombinase/integrase [Pseudomonas asiatica]|uniref:tyrosine-type recombinase/integrase n=1 Tax=Pseudomonas asiatica TaxID=2219225 RepID=UPI0037CABA16